MMLDYTRQRAVQALGKPRTAVLVTHGPAGVQACEFPCEVVNLNVYLLVPQTSDHVFNLEHESTVTLLTVGCEIKGTARIVTEEASNFDLNLRQEPGAAWCSLVHVQISRLQLRSDQGWGNLETIDL